MGEARKVSFLITIYPDICSLYVRFISVFWLMGSEKNAYLHLKVKVGLASVTQPISKYLKLGSNNMGLGERMLKIQYSGAEIFVIL